jgi:hypothetical protein
MRRLRQVFGQDVKFPIFLERDYIAWSRTSCQSGNVDFPVLVVISEASQSQQPGVHRVSPTLVRLQTLNDCHHIKGNPIEGTSSYFFIESSMVSDERELVTRLSGFAVVVSPIEFADKVIQTRIGGLDNVAKYVRDVGRRPGNGIEVSPRHGVRFVISLNEELNVFSVDVPNHSFIEKIEMATCPVKFVENGLNTHTA